MLIGLLYSTVQYSISVVDFGDKRVVLYVYTYTYT